jgi:energy-coupling factor transporter transmembrane protein EcfT
MIASDNPCLSTPMNLAMNHQKQYYFWCFLLFLLVVTLIAPVGTGLTRLITALSATGLWIGVAWLWRSRKPILAGWLIVTVLSGLFLLLPGDHIDPNLLRADYVNNLKTYTQTKYVWGGENHWGIDCSGLVRQGFIRANFLRGLQSANPAPIRSALAMWWFDISAASLKDSYQQWTTTVLAAPSINEIPPNRLLPGDLAATVDGVHILAYIGNSQWIEADPGILKVIQIRVPELDNPWFQVPIKVVRWQQLAQSDQLK